jgi:class 3 adenylate cyclase
MQCPKCQHDNRSAAKFCLECATAPAAKFCGERKTVLFADINKSMQLPEDLDPGKARALVAPALTLITPAVHHCERARGPPPFLRAVQSHHV